MSELYLVSACLVGKPCRYDGKSKPHPKMEAMYRAGLVEVVCPESLSGLPVPRPPAEWRDGRIFLKSGADVTEAFRLGADRALAFALASGLTKAILKARSPSCGCGEIYDGTFTGRIVKGDGLFAAKLKSAGINVMTEQEFEESVSGL